MLDERQIEALRRELAELVHAGHDGSELWYEYHSNESDDPGAVLFHALGAWRIKPGCTTSCGTRRSWRRRPQLLDGAVRFWHDQLFCKPAHDGGVVAWHQDYSYWTRTTPMAHLTCWIGLDDATTENGCVHYVPGSHRWPLLPTTHLAKGMEAILDILTRRAAGPVQAGGVRAEGGRGGVPPPADAARQLREPQPAPAAGGGGQRVPRRDAV